MLKKLLLLALSIVACAQDDPRKQWIADLSSEDVQAREAAGQKLIQEGPSVLQLLEPLLKSADAETKARASQVKSEIERFVRLEKAGQYRKPRLVSLDVSQASLKDVLDQLQKQTETTTKTSVSTIGQPNPITLKFDRVPYLEAMRRVRQACGSIQANYPIKVEDAFCVDIPRIDLNYAHKIAERTTSEKMDIDVRTVWEEGIRPMSATVELTDISDESGQHYQKHITSRTPEIHDGILDWSDVWVSISKVPPFENRRLSVKGFVELSFYKDLEELVLEGPDWKPRSSGDGLVKIYVKEYERERIGVHVWQPVLAIAFQETARWAAALSLEKLKLVDVNGTVLSLPDMSSEIALGQGRYEGNRRFKVTLKDLKQIVIPVLTGSWTRRIEFEFKDIQIK